MLVGKIYDEASYISFYRYYMKSRVDNKEKRLCTGGGGGGSCPKACNVTIQLRYDELTCYMFASIIQAGAISSHVTFRTHFLLGTTAVRYSLLFIMNS